MARSEMTTQPIRVTVWNENVHERESEPVRAIYPDGFHGAIADGLSSAEDLEVRIATLDMPDHGLTELVIEATDVLVWWGHLAHDDVADKVVDRIQRRVLEGMGLIVLHSGHYAKIFKRLMGTTCSLTWREGGERERIWNVAPHHPITAGIGEHFELPNEEMYGEPFGIPTPDELIFISWFEGGEVFRSGATWQRGNGRVFYFRPGHETHPTYHDPQVMKVITNSIRWARPTVRIPDSCPEAAPLEAIGPGGTGSPDR